MTTVALALLIRLQCAAWVGTDYDCQAQWAEDAAIEDGAACRDEGIADTQLLECSTDAECRWAQSYARACRFTP